MIPRRIRLLYFQAESRRASNVVSEARDCDATCGQAENPNDDGWSTTGEPHTKIAEILMSTGTDRYGPLSK